MNSDLLLLCATRMETGGFLALCPPEKEETIRPGLALLSGRIGPKTYGLLITGPGVFNTAHALTAYLMQGACGMMVQIGIAGVFRQTGLAPGDVAVATEERYIHTGVRSDSPAHGPLPFDLIPGRPATRKGGYPFDPDRVEVFRKALAPKLEPKGIRVSKGPFITVSAITGSSMQADRFYSCLSPVMEAMEGAAAAHVAALHNVPMAEIRAASNYAGDRDKSLWNVEKAVQNLGIACASLSV